MSKIYMALKKAEKEGINRQYQSSSLNMLDEKGAAINFDLSPWTEEEYQRLKINLLVPNHRPKVQTLMFVSADHGEGTTTIATIFASILAKNTRSKVLLVDGNIRTPSLNQVFALGNNPGLFDLVFDDAEMDNVIAKTHLSNLSVIIGGHMNSYGSYVFDHEFMNKLMGKLKENYNYIIFDSAPVNIYGDPAILAPQLDGIVLVVQAEKTKIEVVQRAKKQLERVDGKILGVVLNRKKSYIPNFIHSFL